MNLHLITGGSRGLGKALANFLLAKGDHVAEISRSGTFAQANAKSYPWDFASPSTKEPLLHRIFSDFPLQRYKKISLTNNASMVDPIKPIEELPEAELLKNLMVNLYAPLSLTSQFLKATSGFQGTRVIVNVSTGVAKNPKPAWAAYSAAKAGLESFSEALAKAHVSGSELKVVNFEPGVVDTEMQRLIRETPKHDFDELDRFVSLKNNGQLLAPETVGEALGQLILSENLKPKNFVSVYDLL